MDHAATQDIKECRRIQTAVLIFGAKKNKIPDLAEEYLRTVSTIRASYFRAPKVWGVGGIQQHPVQMLLS